MLNSPFAWGEPAVKGVMRKEPADFRVDEIMDVEFSGAGEFDWVHLEKTQMTTPEVAELLQHYSGAKDVNYSGMKDKYAVTRQWFGLHMLGQPSANWSAFDHPQCRILESQRHHRKLRRGTHRYNRFDLLLRGVDKNTIAERLATVEHQGVPNYFGEQRFGGQNLAEARRWFAGGRRPSRFKRGLLLSVARSHLFNAVLAERVVAGTWSKALDGELFMLGDGNSLFVADDNADTDSRLDKGSIQLSGPLVGRTATQQTRCKVASIEQAVLESEPALCKGLEKAGVDAGRRALRVYPSRFDAQNESEGLRLLFSLPRGCFATALVRELIDYSEVAT
ncbi:MAG: tRNA pseudouridine13 synthase [Bermanella sp.]